VRPEALPFTLATLATFCTLCRGPTTPGSGRCNAVMAEWLTFTADGGTGITLLHHSQCAAIATGLTCRDCCYPAVRMTHCRLQLPSGQGEHEQASHTVKAPSESTFSMMGSTMRRRCALPTERFLRTFAQSGTDTPSSFAISRLLAARRW
jgi:hypothetical protein